MIGKSEWQKAYRDSLGQEQKRVGPPPTVEQIGALQRGDLPEDEADRVREQLSYYPDLACAMAASIPEEEEALTPEELDADRAALLAKIRAVPQQPLPFPQRRPYSRALSAAAAVIVLAAVGGIVLWLGTRGETRGHATRVLYADGHRGAGTQTPIQLSTAVDYLLKPVFRPERSYREYRLDLIEADTAPPRVACSRSGIHREPEGSYPVTLSTAKLSPGRYELVLYGIDGDQSTRLASYTLRISAP